MSATDPDHRPGYVGTERMTTRAPTTGLPKAATHHVCIDCEKKFTEDDMISDNRGRWRCWPCADKVLGRA